MKEAIVLYPAGGSHQMISMVELAKLILLHHPNFSFTILVGIMPFDTSSTSSYISSISQTNLPISFLSLPPPSEDPPEAAVAANFSKAAFDYMRGYIPKVLDALKTISLTSTVLAFITTTISITYDTPIPTYLYFTSGASAFATILYLPTIHNQTTKSFKDLPNYTTLRFPGLPPIKPSHLPEPLLDRRHPAYHEFLSLGSSLPNLKGMILNTFDMLEPQAIKAITEGVCFPNGSTPPLYCIGPIIVDARKRGASDDALSKCLLWLDKQPSQSVLFWCFGRKGAFSAAQLKEIAIGLERSEKRFMWVVRNPPPNSDTEPDLEELLPEGFLERTKERGLVLKSWAPQAAILSHQSVGGFVTHCGWNSVLEAVTYGVPMIPWPLYAEQKLNSVVLAEEMRLTPMPILTDHGKEGLVSSEEVERKVREFMGLEGKGFRGRSLEMKTMAMAVWTNGGSSFTALSKLVASWKQNRS